MTARQAELFQKERRPRPVLMHVVDAGHEGTVIAVLECRKCQHRTGWLKFNTVTEAKRGLPCPNCSNAAGAPVDD
jgi:hypothetical protein